MNNKHIIIYVCVVEHAMNNPLQLTIPAVDTTYWCSVFRLPQEVRQQERYIFKVTEGLLLCVVKSIVILLASMIQCRYA